MIGIEHYVVVSSILFVLGVLGIFLNRKNIIVILMAIELILLSVNINLVAFSAFLGDLTGQVFAMFVLTVAAGEAAIGLAIGGEETPMFSGGPPIQFIGKSVVGGDSEADRSRQVENSKGYSAAKELIYDSILRRATDIHLEPQETETAVRIRVDGVMHAGEAFSRDTGQAVVNVLKVLSAMDITERRKPQDGSFRALLTDREIDFRVATQGTRSTALLGIAGFGYVAWRVFGTDVFTVVQHGSIGAVLMVVGA